MSEDLKIIKKMYGEKMAHFCREMFPTLLESEGLLASLLTMHFEPNHSLYEDITCQGIENEFKNYLYSLVDVEDNYKVKAPRNYLRKRDIFCTNVNVKRIFKSLKNIMLRMKNYVLLMGED